MSRARHYLLLASPLLFALTAHCGDDSTPEGVGRSGSAGSAGAGGAGGVGGGAGGSAGAGGSVGAGGAGGIASLLPRVAAGGANTCAWREGDRKAYCWGNNASGQVGSGALGGTALAPAAVSGASGGLPSGVTQIAVGGGHACARLADGSAHCWGDNASGQLGDGAPGAPRANPGPVLAGAGMPLGDVSQIASGAASACARLGDGTARCWGQNDVGQLGKGSTDASGGPSPTPSTVVDEAGAALSRVRAIASGPLHACAVLDDGTARCWGQNDVGQLGRGSTDAAGVPFAVEVRDGASALAGVRQIEAGDRFTCALLEGGGVRCWGSNDAGQLGAAPVGSSAVPVAIEEAPAKPLSNVAAIALGAQHACARLNGGRVVCWGSGADGRRANGPGPAGARTNVALGPDGTPLSNAIELGLGAGHSCAALADRTLLCWGRNEAGQVGDGSVESRPLPIGVLSL